MPIHFSKGKHSRLQRSLSIIGTLVGVTIIVYLAAAVVWWSWQLHLWITPRFNKSMMPLWEAVDRLPASQSTWMTIVVSVLTVGTLIAGALHHFEAFSIEHRKTNRWLKVTFWTLVLFQIVAIALYIGLQLHFIDSVLPIPQARRNLLLETFVVQAVLTVGILVYLFKKKYQILYGFSEILIGVCANLDSLGTIHEEQLRDFSFGHVVLLKLLVFTYLLSRGVTNVSEGVEKWQGMKLEPESEVAFEEEQEEAGEP